MTHPRIIERVVILCYTYVAYLVFVFCFYSATIFATILKKKSFNQFWNSCN